MLKKILQQLNPNLIRLVLNLNKIEKILVNDSLEKLKKESRYSDHKSLIPYGYKIYSQHEEDGRAISFSKRP